jgi:hypothetical protein
MNRLILLIPIGLLLLGGVSSGRAQTRPADDYDIAWHTIDGGGAMNASGGSFGLSGTIGQPEAGRASGGSYTLNSGFWIGAAGAIDYKVYLPLVLKNL